MLWNKLIGQEALKIQPGTLRLLLQHMLAHVPYMMQTLFRLKFPTAEKKNRPDQYSFVFISISTHIVT